MTKKGFYPSYSYLIHQNKNPNLCRPAQRNKQCSIKIVCGDGKILDDDHDKQDTIKAGESPNFGYLSVAQLTFPWTRWDSFAYKRFTIIGYSAGRSTLSLMFHTPATNFTSIDNQTIDTRLFHWPSGSNQERFITISCKVNYIANWELNKPLANITCRFIYLYNDKKLLIMKPSYCNSQLAISFEIQANPCGRSGPSIISVSQQQL